MKLSTIIRPQSPLEAFLYCAIIALAFMIISSLAGCDKQATVVNENMKNDADNFRIARHIRVINTRAQAPIYEIEGYCNIDKGDSLPNELIFICKTDDGQFEKNFAFLNDNVTVSVRQIHPSAASTFRYKYTFNPSVIIPNIELNTGK